MTFFQRLFQGLKPKTKPDAKPTKQNSRLTAGAAITALLVATVGAYEGLRLNTYKDAVGVPTICYGETEGVVMGQSKTKAECDDMLVKSLQKHEGDMRRCLDDPDGLPEKTYAAFVSFTYNVGSGNFCSSTLRRKANAGDLVGACNELTKWVYATDRRTGERIKLRGLVKRREGERALCLEGIK